MRRFTHKQAPAESSVGRTYSSKPSRGNDIGTPPSETGKSRGKMVQSSDPSLSLGIKEAYSTRSPPASTQNQPKPDIGIPPKGNSMGVTPLSTQGQHKPNIESTSVVLPSPMSRTPIFAEGPQIPTTSSGKPPSFPAALRLTSDTLLDVFPEIDKTTSGLKGRPESQVQPEVPSRLDFAQREAKALAALEGRYQVDPIIARSEMPAQSLSPIHSGGIMKQPGTNLNQNKFQYGGLGRAYS